MEIPRQIQRHVIAPMALIAAAGTLAASKPPAPAEAEAPAPKVGKAINLGEAPRVHRSRVVKPPLAPLCAPAPLESIDSVPVPAEGGLEIVSEPPLYYDIDGYTPGQIYRQIRHCSPIEADEPGYKAAAAIQGRPNWHADFYITSENDAICGIRNEGVTMHTRAIYPAWRATPHKTVPGLRALWPLYTEELVEHEEGHVAIGAAYAQKLYDGLVAFPEQPCNVISENFSAYVGQVLAEEGVAQEQYDDLEKARSDRISLYDVYGTPKYDLMPVR